MPASAELQALLDAHNRGYALAAINIYNLEGAQAIALAARAENTPAIIQIGSSALRLIGQAGLAGVALAFRRVSDLAIGVHLDHCRDLTELQDCLDAGYTSVMIDGSHLSLAENIELTRRAVHAAHNSGAWIEAELGAVAGHEDRSSDTIPPTMTDPDQAAEFVDATGIDALAVAIGNVHGIPTRPISLDIDRLKAIHAATPIPLVLHGASGLMDPDLQQAISVSVAKININTEVRRAYIAALRNSLNTADGDDLSEHLLAARAAATLTIRHKIRAYSHRSITTNESR